jgi:hypothetical protein
LSLLVHCGGQSIRIINVETGQLQHEIRPAEEGSRWTDFAVSPASPILAIGGSTSSKKGTSTCSFPSRSSKRATSSAMNCSGLSAHGASMTFRFGICGHCHLSDESWSTEAVVTIAGRKRRVLRLIPRIDNRTEVLILQHQRERFHPFNTA